MRYYVTARGGDSGFHRNVVGVPAKPSRQFVYIMHSWALVSLCIFIRARALLLRGGSWCDILLTTTFFFMAPFLRLPGARCFIRPPSFFPLMWVHKADRAESVAFSFQLVCFDSLWPCAVVVASRVLSLRGCRRPPKRSLWRLLFIFVLSSLFARRVGRL